ncbi:hypothetical protein [Paenibacillus kobensis]|uniref:hypothetical protein n=1 Tax=Paenibacillus kobensis TaxID=59841 RepID=UPI000FD76C94|nr:hypothetical protein [Paenibacillus kobensis]
MDSLIVYCVNVVAVGGVPEYRNINLLEDVFFMDVTPKPSNSKKHTEPPAGITRFHTKYGVYLQLNSLEKYEEALSPHGYDYFMPSLLVNTNIVDRIVVTDYGRSAFFKGGEDLNIPVSKYKTKEYDYLIVRG